MEGMKRKPVYIVYTEGSTDGIIVCDTEKTANEFIDASKELCHDHDMTMTPVLKIKSIWMYEKET